MEDARTRALVGECISRAAVDAARGATIGEIEQAIDACDYERAATLAFGRVRGGENVPVEVIARVLPGIELPAITFALMAIARERAPLIEMIERRRFPQTRESAELEAIVLYAAWRAGAEHARVIPELRRLSARAMSVEGYALLATIAQSIDDPNIAAATKPIAAFAKEYAKHVAEDDKALAASIEAVIASLPPEVELAAAAGFTVRATKQAGRNDPCPCGSGLKYKKCCADKQVTPSPVPGLSYEEFLGAGAARMKPEHVEELPLRDLVRVDLGRLSHRCLRLACQRFTAAHEWRHSERVLDELGRRTVDESGDYADPALRADDDFRHQLVLQLLECKDMSRAREQIAKLPADMAKEFALELAIADGPEPAWRALVARVRETVASTSKLDDVDLAYSLLRAEPALGIYFARACIGTLHVDVPDVLLDTVEEARDELNVLPEDPAWAVLDALSEQEPDQSDEATKLRESLQQSSERVDQLERMLAAMRVELESARTRPIAELMRAPEDRDRVGSLDAKVRELEALLREGNAERRELRKQLQHANPAEAHARREGPRARRATAVETDDDVGDDVEVTTRGIAIPRFERRATDALGDVPTTVAAEAMRTIGTLCAGDGGAWRGVKQAKDMTRPLLMARVGIHHRLLFRVDEGMLDVVDLITREQLLTTLKRLRAGR